MGWGGGVEREGREQKKRVWEGVGGTWALSETGGAVADVIGCEPSRG